MSETQHEWLELSRGKTLRQLEQVVATRRQGDDPSSAPDSALLELVRCALRGPNDVGRASYQIVVSVCPECNSAGQHSAVGLVPVDPELIRRAHCDAQHVPALPDPSPLPANKRGAEAPCGLATGRAARL
ncbi:MAG TPA: hypothetical protein VFS67_20730 [Polyangiaceae bacterium]|nr:hypothetical protein [Polyangiaceae bacterium]